MPWKRRRERGGPRKRAGNGEKGVGWRRNVKAEVAIASDGPTWTKRRQWTRRPSGFPRILLTRADVPCYDGPTDRPVGDPCSAPTSFRQPHRSSAKRDI